MGWGVGALVAVVALLGWTVFLNARPARCPLCRRVNILRRARTGRFRDERDGEGDLRRSSAEFACGRCGGLYWVVWDDFAGIHASVSLPDDQRHAEPGAAPDRGGTS